MTPGILIARTANYLLLISLIAGTYFVLGLLGMLLNVPPSHAGALWPPAGIALAAMLLLGKRIWPGVFIGNFLISAWAFGFNADSILVNAITSFSNRPLVYVFYLGCSISFFAGIAALYLVVRRLFFGEYLAGWPSLIVSIWLLGGLTIFCLGILGVYLSKIFMETKPRPYTIIRRIHGPRKEGEE